MQMSEVVQAAIQRLDLIDQQTRTLPQAIAEMENAIIDTKILSASSDTPAMQLLRELFQGLLVLMQKPNEEKNT